MAEQHENHKNMTLSDKMFMSGKDLIQRNSELLASLTDIIKKLETSKAQLEAETEDSPGAPIENTVLREELLKDLDTVGTCLQQLLDKKEAMQKVEAVHQIALDQEIAQATAGLTETANVFEDADNEMLLNKQIVQHLTRSNMNDVAQSLAHESGIPNQLLEAAQKLTPNDGKFQNFLRITENIKQHNTEPAIEWLTDKTEPVLVFFKHMLIFMKMLKAPEPRNIDAQITYLRLNIKPLAENEAQKSLMREMTRLWIYADPEVTNLPGTVSHEEVQKFWHDVAGELMHEMCAVEHVPLNSPLETLLTAAFSVVPEYLKGKKLTKALKSYVRDSKVAQFHSKFECPIMKEITTASNPAVALSCQHIISKRAAVGITFLEKILCPFCKKTTKREDVKAVFF